jgi:hypothetical protein
MDASFAVTNSSNDPAPIALTRPVPAPPSEVAGSYLPLPRERPDPATIAVPPVPVFAAAVPTSGVAKTPTTRKAKRSLTSSMDRVHLTRAQAKRVRNDNPPARGAQGDDPDSDPESGSDNDGDRGPDQPRGRRQPS